AFRFRRAHHQGQIVPLGHERLEPLRYPVEDPVHGRLRQLIFTRAPAISCMPTAEELMAAPEMATLVGSHFTVSLPTLMVASRPPTIPTVALSTVTLSVPLMSISVPVSSIFPDLFISSLLLPTTS